MTRFLTIIALVLALAPTAFARDATQAEKDALIETTEAFVAAMAALDYPTVISLTPPRIHDHIAAQAGITTAQLTAAIEDQFKQAMAIVTMESFALDASAATYLETPKGDPYALMPTRTVMDVPEVGRVRSDTQTLALIDDGTWYLVRVDELQQVLILREVYPDFAGVTFPTGSMTVLE